MTAECWILPITLELLLLNKDIDCIIRKERACPPNTVQRVFSTGVLIITEE